jgi:hypothetical protein
MSQSGRPLLSNVYNKNSYFSGNGVKTSSVSAETNTLTTAASETVKLKDSTGCLLERPTDGYNRYRQKQTRELGGEQSRSELAGLRRRPKQTEELAELAELRGDSRQTVKTDTRKGDTGRQLT